VAAYAMQHRQGREQPGLRPRPEAGVAARKAKSVRESELRP
jgi:hypothetical protein